jgi:DNA-binding NtrC family response regulator
LSIGILIVDDDATQRSDLAELVASFGYEAITAADGREAIESLEAASPRAILADLVMPRMDGFALLKELAARGDRTPTIIMTGQGSIDQAVSIVHDLKAFWFLEKPAQPNVMRTLLERAVQQNQLTEETEQLRRQLSYQGVLGDLVGDSPQMREIFSLIRQIARTSASVLITGESGTGKELVARAIHSLSSRGDGPFVAMNCAALPESLVESELFGHEKGSFTGAVGRMAGCFEQANHGTLLLDEIGEMPMATQAKLLRVIEESSVRRLGGSCDIPVDTRVLAATNRPPQLAIQSKHLREDLYYRLNVIHISLPPLRERKQDIPSIAEALIRDLNRKHGCRITGLSPGVLQQLEARPWPGNVRELRNVIEHGVIVASEGEIQPWHLPRTAGRATPAPVYEQPAAEGVLQVRVGQPVSAVEEAYIKLTLKHTGDNRRKAAGLLGLCLRTLHNKLRQYESAKPKAVAAADAETDQAEPEQEACRGASTA